MSGALFQDLLCAMLPTKGEALGDRASFKRTLSSAIECKSYRRSRIFPRRHAVYTSPGNRKPKLRLAYVLPCCDALRMAGGDLYALGTGEGLLPNCILLKELGLPGHHAE